MSALTRYHALYESLRTRRRRPKAHTGLDSLAAFAGLKLRERRVTLSSLRSEAERVDAHARDLRSHSDAALNEVVRELRELFVRGREDQAALRRAVAAVREVARRETGEEAYPVQLMGAMALYHGKVVEMLTGEGKTLTGSIAAPLLAWKHRRLHVLTVNDYLAERDAVSRAPIFKRCGCDVGAILQTMEDSERAANYAKPIIFGTPKQVTADWLRDQIRLGPLATPWAGRRLLDGPSGAHPGPGSNQGPMIPGLRAAMVDEADAVLIDEGVVPLIIARAREENELAPVYRDACAIAQSLEEGTDYTLEQLRRRAELTRRGQERVRARAGALSDAIWRATRRSEELVRQALVARHCYQLGHHYQIVDGQVVLVDEYTGRFLADRQWEHGLHQAVEAKERLEITADRETLARVSFQRFYRTYPFLCGMTGTAADAALEIERVYNRAVLVIPTHRPIAREAWPTRAFRTREGKWNAIVNSIEQVHATRRPILVGTRSIEASEFLSERLTARGLNHRVLNANFDKDEAELIAHAGKRGAITVATNMAGRGTDIKLDLESRQVGGLHVLLTEMHAAKRVDRQFIGRAGRQGDPGSAQLCVSLEDEVVRLYARRLSRVFARTIGLAGVTSDAATDELTGSTRVRAIAMFRLAQRAAEARARRQRGDVLRQDDWIDKHLPGG